MPLVNVGFMNSFLIVCIFIIIHWHRFLDWWVSSPHVSLCTKMDWSRKDHIEVPVKLHHPEKRVRCCDTFGDVKEILFSETSEQNTKLKFKCLKNGLLCNSFHSNSMRPLLKLWNRKALELSEESADPFFLPWLWRWVKLHRSKPSVVGSRESEGNGRLIPFIARLFYLT